MKTALYLAHLNPVTNAHVEIIKELKKEADIVKVMPVIFKYDNREVNSKSFPFNFETRKKMLESIFGDSIKITDDYAFLAPFKKYLPPLVRRKSWKLRKQILNGVEGDYFSYTGDKAEGYMLKMYRLKPKIGERKALSATSVKEKMYDAALEKESTWKEDVPEEIVKIIESVLKRIGKKHPATKTFQAIRIHVNNELEHLEIALSKVSQLLNKKGVIAIISFHSLEDRIVKNFFKPDIQSLPKDIPINNVVNESFHCIKKKVKPSAEEIKRNPRSRSAVMRVYSKL